ncbi:MAG: lipocalin family protein [Kiritimatiellales bacterium]|nr:lipocalin family protein [Kiritimatiellales bacterium]MCF7863497.1 lipocalin family protein [Kiritimatiellales bacterium]
MATPVETWFNPAMRKNSFSHAVLLLSLAALAGCKSTSDLDVVSGFDAARYLGTWYEAVRYPHRFEKGLSSVSAEYSRHADGTIKVVNRGFDDAKHEWKSIEGVAKPKGDPTRGWLKVSFFKPFYASYKIIHLNADYTQAIVTGPTYGYFWILVRDPSLPEAELDKLIRLAEKAGFDPARMQIVDQSKNET